MSKADKSGSPARWKCVCAYHGGHFAGWQSQTNAVGVQDVLEAALKSIFGEAIRIHGSGRTDAGVHALAQVFHFDARWPHGPDKLLAAFRPLVPTALQVQTVRKVGPKFHARYSATGKRYHYNIFQGYAGPFDTDFHWSIVRTLDIDAMRKAAERLVGRHDFTAYSALNGDEVEDKVKDLRALKVAMHGRRIRITAEASGFLYKMVRSLAGALVNAGLGKLTPDEISTILESKQRVPLIQTAPPQGLFLERVFY